MGHASTVREFQSTSAFIKSHHIYGHIMYSIAQKLGLSIEQGKCLDEWLLTLF